VEVIVDADSSYVERQGTMQSVSGAWFISDCAWREQLLKPRADLRAGLRTV